MNHTLKIGSSHGHTLQLEHVIDRLSNLIYMINNRSGHYVGTIDEAGGKSVVKLHYNNIHIYEWHFDTLSDAKIFLDACEFEVCWKYGVMQGRYVTNYTGDPDKIFDTEKSEFLISTN